MVSKIIEKITGTPTRAFANDKELFLCQFTQDPLAIFIDVMLSVQLSGIDLIPGLRQRWPFVPIIVITGLDDDIHIGKALAAGANDFIKKPLQPLELKARLRARMTEMQQKAETKVIHYADFSYDRSSLSLTVADRRTHLSPYCGKILESLLEGSGMTIPRDELKLKVWGDIKVAQNTVDKRISELRSVLKKMHSQVEIQSIYGNGLTLKQPETPAKSA